MEYAFLLGKYKIRDMYYRSDNDNIEHNGKHGLFDTKLTQIY